MDFMTTNFKKAICQTVCLLALLLCLAAVGAATPARLDVPSAEMQIEDATPLSLVKKIALRKAVEKWGPGALGEPIPLCDLKDNVKAYMFSFHIGADSFPDYDRILLEVKAGRKLWGLLQRADHKAAKALYQQLSPPASTARAAPSEADRSIKFDNETLPAKAIERQAKRAARREMKKFAAKKSIGADTYGTIVIAASYSMVPVICYLHYLAPYYFNFDLALEKAERVLGPGTELRRIYFLGLAGQFFKFAHGAQSILLNAKTLEVSDEVALSQSAVSAAQVEKQPQKRRRLKDEIGKKWDRMRSEVGEE